MSRALARQSNTYTGRLKIVEISSIKYRGLSHLQKFLLFALWAGAIGIVIYIGNSVPPIEQNSSAFQLKLLSPIALAFILTIIITVCPTGKVQRLDFEIEPGEVPLEIDDTKLKTFGWRLKASLLVMLGMIWASAIALIVIGVTSLYTELVIQPLCKIQLRNDPQLIYSSARLPLEDDSFGAVFGTYHPIECQFNNGTQVITLNDIIGSFSEYVVHYGSFLAVIILSLIAWGLPTCGVFICWRKLVNRRIARD